MSLGISICAPHSRCKGTSYDSHYTIAIEWHIHQRENLRGISSLKIGRNEGESLDLGKSKHICKAVRVEPLISSKEKLWLQPSKRELSSSPEDFEWRKLMREIEQTESPVTVLKSKMQKKRKLSRTALVGALVRFKQMKAWKFAIETAEWLMSEEWYDFNQSDYDLLLSAYAKEGKHEKSEDLFKKMQSCGLSPNVASYTSLLEAYATKGLCKEAEIIFQKMLTSGPSPTIVTYQTMLKAYIEAGKIDDAETLFSNLMSSESQASSHNTSDTPLLPDVRMYNLMIHAYGKVGNLEKAFELLERMKSAGLPPSVITFNSLITFQSNSEDAYAIFRKMQLFKVKADVYSYTALIHAYSKARRPEEARSAFKEMIAYGIRPTKAAFNALIDAYAKTNQVDAAEMVFKAMSQNRCRPNIQSYTSLISAHVNVHDIEKAEQIFFRVKSAGLAPNRLTYGAMIKGYANVKNMGKMMKMFDEMRAVGITPDHVVYTILVGAYGENEDFDNSMLLLKEMISNGIRPDEVCRNTLMSACKTTDQKQEVLGLLESTSNMTLNGPSFEDNLHALSF